MFFNEFKNRLALNKSFVIETTLSGKYSIEYIKKAKDIDAND
jgi:predicted ABC-type ATPase